MTIWSLFRDWRGLASTQVVETSVTVTNNSFHDHNHSDCHTRVTIQTVDRLIATSSMIQRAVMKGIGWGGLGWQGGYCNKENGNTNTLYYWMKWCELREYKWNEYVTIAVNRNLSNCENSPKKRLSGFNGIRTRGLCVSAAVLSQLSYEDPYTVDELNKLAGLQCMCLHSSAGRALQR